MATTRTGSRFPFVTDYEDQTPDELVFPEDLSTLSDDEVEALLNQAVEAFQDIYGDGKDLTNEQVETLGTLKEGITAVRAEQGVRQEAAAERSEAAAAIAAEAGVESSSDDEPESDPAGENVDEADEVDADNTETAEAEAGAEDKEDALVASGRGPARVSLRNVRRKTVTRSASSERQPDQYGNRTMRDIVTAAPDAKGLQSGQGVDWSDLAKSVDRRLASFPLATYKNAASRGRRLREQHSLAVINKPQDSRLTIKSSDETHVSEVLANARDEHALPQGSLVASGGWCAPSETIYDLCELESRDGLISVPEVTIARGGLQFTAGPDFSSIYNDTGFCYTEAEDIAGDYDGEGGGTKPCFHVDCPEFTDERLGLCGVCISAGLLQARGYPELIARFLRGAMVAHDHRVSANFINSQVAGSTAVTIASADAGAAAPVLAAVELQAEHMRYANRMARNATIEAVFPYWVRGVIRADLSRRLGVDLLSVTDAQIDGWFAQRGIAPQFVYDWQDIATDAASGFTAFPTTVSFLLYPAGTWVKGASDIITLDNVYDSVGLGTNDYTALFSEEGWLAAKMCHDSRVITVGVCADGATAAGVDLTCDGFNVVGG